MKILFAALLLAVVTDVVGAGAVTTSTTGTTQVQTGQASPRTLRTGDQIAQGDTIVTGANSAAVLKFDDGQVVALTANSRMQVTAYAYNSATENGNVLLSLVSGGMRAITGLIGRRAPNQVAYRAATATIGVRGTDITIATADGNVVVTVSEGSISFAFQGQVLTINAGEAALARPGQPVVLGTPAQIAAQAPAAIQQAVQQQAALTSAVTNANPGNPPQGQQGQQGDSGQMAGQTASGGWFGFPWIGSPGPTSGGYPLGGPRESPNATLVEVLYATNRNLLSASPMRFGGDRSAIHYGSCEVSIPLSHKMGELESPSLWRLEFRSNPEKHIVLVRTNRMREREFFRELGYRVGEGRNAFLFVHGYNVSFEDAARRTAQLHYDLQFDGAPVFFSWPSQASLPGYPVDETNVEWAQADLRVFIDDFFRWSKAENIYLIAHSMGTRALTRTLSSLMAERPEYRPRLREVILAAPDIDADVFRRDIAPALAASGRPVTLYASSKDVALGASKQFHGYARAGDSGAGLVIAKGVETIDATEVDTSLVGHSTFAESRSALSDMFYLIKKSLRPDERHGLRPIDTPTGRYWVLAK